MGKQTEARKDGEERQNEAVIDLDHNYGKFSSVKFIHKIMDDVLSLVVNVETDYNIIIRKESNHSEAKEVEEGEIVNDNEEPDELIETWVSDVSNEETCFDEIFPNSYEKKEIDE